MIGAASDPFEVQAALASFTGDLAFDIGGNVGETARSLASRFTTVISCEPCGESYAELASSVPDNVTALPVAVSDHRGAVTLDEQEHPIKSGQLTTGGYEGWGRVLGRRTVECTTLDDLTEQFGAPDLVKIDTEAHELHVVRGGVSTLSKHTPCLYIEVHGADLGAEIAGRLRPSYGDRLERVQHPNYVLGDWGYDNHYWLIAR